MVEGSDDGGASDHRRGLEKTLSSEGKGERETALDAEEDLACKASY